MVTTLKTSEKKQAIQSMNCRWQLKKMNVEIAILLTIGQPRRNLNHMNLEGSFSSFWDFCYGVYFGGR